MSSTPQKLQEIIKLNLEIASIQDLDTLLEKILGTARALVNAEAGCVYIYDGETLQCRYMQNDALGKQFILEKDLTPFSHCVSINHSSLIGYVGSTGETLTIPDVAQWPDDASCAFDLWYDSTFKYRTQSLLIVPLRYYQDDTVGILYLMNARDENGAIMPFSESDIPVVQIFANHVAIPIERAQTAKVRIQGLIRLLIELDDPEETEGHLHRVGAYSAEIFRLWAYARGLSQTHIEAEAETLRTAAMLHDLGKLAIPHHIRQKPEKLSVEEFAVMKQHALKGAQMLLKSSQSEYEDMAVQIALNHHECWDGSGYPGHINPLTEQVIPGHADQHGAAQPKHGEEIPIFGRVVAVADVYDALSCDRVHRKAMTEADALEIVRAESGKRFDPEVVDAFFAGLDAIREIARQFPEASKS